MTQTSTWEEIWISASQVQLWEECERKYGFKYLERIVQPQHPSAKLGDEVQAQLDQWLIEGKSFDFTQRSGEIAQALVPLLPVPKAPGLKVRRNFRIPSPSGRFQYVGQLDLYAADSVVVPGLAGGVPLVGDIKTTGNLDYAKDEEKLKTDIQAQLYAMEVMFTENVDTVDLGWFYARTRAPHRVQRYALRVSAPHVVEQFGKIEETAIKVAEVKVTRPKVEDLTPNPRMCEQYGGCPFRHRCNLAPPVFAGAWNLEAKQDMNAATNDFLASLRKTVAPVAAPAMPVAPVAAAPAPVAPTVVNTPSGPNVYGPGWGPPQSPPPAMTPAPVPTTVPAAFAAPAPAAPPAINPPESALPPAPPVGAAGGAPSAEKPARGPGRPRKTAAETPAPAAPAAAGPTLADAPALAGFMKENGIKSLTFDGDRLTGIGV